MSERKVLLVGQQEIADDLNQAFAGSDVGWKLAFVSNFNQAVSELTNGDFALLVTELVLRDSEACELLQQVKELYPGTIRIVLTADEDREKLLRASAYAHQVISKPIKPEVFRMRVNNALSLREVFANEKLHARIAGINSLPTVPGIYNQLVAEIQSETASMQKIANLIKQDVSITAKLLHMSNSAFFGLSTRVESPLQAANLLGIDTVKSLVLAAGVFDQFSDHSFPGYSVDAIYNHSIAVGANAKHLANAFGLGRKTAEEALMAGMMHDIGKLVLLTNFREELTRVVSLSQSEEILMYDAERKILGVSHCEIGAHLLSLWGMSDLILEAVCFHDTPQKCVSPMVNILTTVHVANALDHDQAMTDRDPKFTSADLVYLTRLGLHTQLPYLRTLSSAK